MPAIVVCAACQTKLKVPENSKAKALRCPKCKGIVPVAPAMANPDAPPAEPKPAPPPEPKQEPDEKKPEEPKADAPPEEQEEFEVNEAVDEQEEESEVNEAADEQEEEKQDDEDSPLVELGFGKGKDPFKVADIPEPARKAIQKAFVKGEKALWAGKPSKEIIESKAWLGFAVAGGCVAFTLVICVVTGGMTAAMDNTAVRILAPSCGGLLGLVILGVGVLAVVYRKRLGGNVLACYVVTNERAYIYDGQHAVRAFTPEQLADIHTKLSEKFEGAGDLIFAYDLMGDQGTQVNRAKKEEVERSAVGRGASGSTPVGFMNIHQVQMVQHMMLELLIEPGMKKAKKRSKKLKKKGRRIF